MASFCYSASRIFFFSHIRRLLYSPSASRCFSSKELTQTTDFLLQNIKSSTSMTAVLQLVGSHHNIMNGNHVLQALKSIFELKKSGLCEFSKEDLVHSPDFIKLCKRLKSQARGYNLNDTIEALKIVSYLGMPADSIIVQALLQLIRHGVNDLSLHHIIFTEFILRNFNYTPLVKALKIALPLVFEAQLKVKMNRGDALHLADLLQYAVSKPVSEASVALIVECLEKVTDDIDVETARRIVWSFCDTRRELPPHQNLLRRCWSILSQHIDKCSFEEMVKLLQLMVKKSSRNDDMHVYHEKFVESCAMYVVEKDCGFENGTFILRKLTKLGHVSLKLIDYLGEKIVNDPRVGETCQLSSLISFLSGMANADYKPMGWDCIQEALGKNKLFYEERTAVPWMQIALNCLTLDMPCIDLIKRIFDDEFLTYFLSRDYNFLDQLQLVLLHQAVNTLCPSYSGPWPSEAILEGAKDLVADKEQDFPLQAALERGLGGQSYVWTGVFTKLGHFIDHTVVMRKGGYPVALNHTSTKAGSKTYVEDILVPSDGQMILILCLPESCYNINCQRLRAVPTLTLRTLEALGHTVVPISLRTWSSLPEFEKIPYLMQNIKAKCESLDCSNEIRSVH